MVWQVGGRGLRVMINIAIVSMHAILYIDILGPTSVMSGGHAPLPPPCSTAYAVYTDHFYNSHFVVYDFNLKIRILPL